MITQSGSKLILCVSTVGLLIVILLYNYGPLATQTRNLALARDYAASKMKEIKSFNEFKEIEISQYTDHGGSLLVRGVVRHDDAKRLKKIIYTNELPVKVEWRVDVIGDLTWDHIYKNK